MINLVIIEMYFFMLKKACGKKYNTGQQGSKQVIPKASFMMVGNLSDLKIPKGQYQKRVSKIYRQNSGKQFDYNTPLFKGIEWVVGVLNLI